MRRFYIIDLQPDLFGQWSLIRKGCIGRPGQTRVATCPNETKPGRGSLAPARVKERRGYRAAHGSGTAGLPS